MHLSLWKVSILFISLGLANPIKICSKPYPANGAVISAIRTMLTADKIDKASTYIFKVAIGPQESEKSLMTNLSLSQTSAIGQTIVNLPAFDKEYSWLVEYYTNGKKIKVSPVYHFSVATPKADSPAAKYRVRVITNKYKDSQLLFFSDLANTLYGLNGEAVWRLPQIVKDTFKTGMKSDIRMTAFNTVTFISSGQGYEIDYTGKVLWQTPIVYRAGTKIPVLYHHEFCRLESGNYMIVSSEIFEKKLPAGANLSGKDSMMQLMDFGVLMLYNSQGELIWQWKASEYFTPREVYEKRSDGSLPPPTHMNAFYFDEKKNVIYAGFRNIDRIVKIKYPEKTILAAYNGAINGRKNFRMQHTLRINKEGNLCVFSNYNGGANNLNLRRSIGDHDIEDSTAKLVILREYGGDSSGYEKIWEFDCDLDKQASHVSSRGGNFTELADGNYFVCMGGSPRIFIVSKDKEILYNAVIEQWNNSAIRWEPFPQYRANPVYLKDLDKFILGSLQKH